MLQKRRRERGEEGEGEGLEICLALSHLGALREVLASRRPTLVQVAGLDLKPSAQETANLHSLQISSHTPLQQEETKTMGEWDTVGCIYPKMTLPTTCHLSLSLDF